MNETLSGEHLGMSWTAEKCSIGTVRIFLTTCRPLTNIEQSHIGFYKNLYYFQMVCLQIVLFPLYLFQCLFFLTQN